jgi:uncharacterized protein YkwD
LLQCRALEYRCASIQHLHAGPVRFSVVKIRESWLVILGASLVLAGCGGGDDESSASAPPTLDAQATQEPSPDPTEVQAQPSTRATCNLADFGAELLDRVNAYRAAGASCGSKGSFPPASALVWNAPLTQASLRHSDDMVAAQYFSHTGSDGSSVGQRATEAGYVWHALGENIAAGQGSVAAVMSSWMASPGHCANIMQARFRDLGVACVKGSSANTYGTYWTMALGAAR